MGREEDQEDIDWQRVIASGFSAGGIDSAVPKLGGDVMKHAEDAIDYGEEDELADDESLPEEEPPSGNNRIDEGDDLAGLTEGTSDLYHSAPSYNQHLQQNLGSHNLGYDALEPSLEDRVGSDYAAALMSFDDDWMGGGGGYDFNDSMKSSYDISTGPSIANGNLSRMDSNIDGDIDMDDDLRTLPSSDDEADQRNQGDEKENDDKVPDEQLLRMYYPDFVPGGILKINTIFAPRNAHLVLPKPKVTRTLVPTKVHLEVEPDQRLEFKSKNVKERFDSRAPKVVKVHTTTLAAVSNLSCENLNDDEVNERKVKNEHLEEDLLIATADWDTDNLWNEKSDNDMKVSQGSNSSDTDESEDEKIPNSTAAKTVPLTRKPSISTPEIYNSEDEDGFFEGIFNTRKNKAILDMNDSRMLFTTRSNTQNSSLYTQRSIAQIPTTEKMLQLRYNISNDRAYDLLKENYQSKVRSMVGNLNIDHSMVALRLQSPHYKVKLSKAQMRSYHRPTFVVKPNTTIHFSKIKQRKRKRDKGKKIQELLNKTTDLTLGDSAQFFLLEYSEEFPLMLSNFGMGSKIINYYRKSSNEDQSRPKLSTGETHVLSLQDRSAFWNFGFVEPGKIVPTLYNKLIRAPVFKHEPSSKDFLLIRSTGGSQGQRYYLRSIPHQFTVGQTFPVDIIPGPHSRKVTTASKNRLKMVVFRVLNKSERHRISVRDISAHFPGQNEMQNRQRLKEFMEFQRHGEDQGFWKIKAKETLPAEEQIRSMISPEDISLLEAMQVGQQHLEDAGYSKTVNDEDVEGDSIEKQLAPWNITRNFIHATQGKAMLQLHGEGDPSGSGHAFSFLRTSMKGGFKAAGESVNEKLDKSKFGGHSYNVAMQQKAYDDEISRIWYSQAKTLSNTNIEDLGWDEAESRREEGHDSTHFETVSTPLPNLADDDDGTSMFSHNSSRENQNKILKITRFVRDENGTVQRKVETLTEPNLIRAYVKRRQEIEDSLIGYVVCMPFISLTNVLELTKLHLQKMRRRTSDIASALKHPLPNFNATRNDDWTEGHAKMVSRYLKHRSLPLLGTRKSPIRVSARASPQHANVLLAVLLATFAQSMYIFKGMAFTNNCAAKLVHCIMSDMAAAPRFLLHPIHSLALRSQRRATSDAFRQNKYCI